MAPYSHINGCILPSGRRTQLLKASLNDNLNFFSDKLPWEFVKQFLFCLFFPHLSSSRFTSSDPAVHFWHEQMFKPAYAKKMRINGWLCEGKRQFSTQYNRFNLLFAPEIHAERRDQAACHKVTAGVKQWGSHVGLLLLPFSTKKVSVRIHLSFCHTAHPTTSSYFISLFWWFWKKYKF